MMLSAKDKKGRYHEENGEKPGCKAEKKATGFAHENEIGPR